MSYDNFTIGNDPTMAAFSQLKFHQYTIYDNQNWNQDGYICYNAQTREFYLVPFVAKVENKKLSELNK